MIVMVDDQSMALDTMMLAVENAIRPPLILFQRTRTPQFNIDELLLAPRRVYVYADIPASSKSIARMHGARAATPSNVAYGKSVSNRFTAMAGELDATRVKYEDLATTQNVAAELTSQIAGLDEADMAIVVGHVSKGRIVFHDGSSLELSSIQSRAKLAFVGCDTIRSTATMSKFGIGTTRTLDYSESIPLVRTLASRAVAPKGSVRDALMEVQLNEMQRYKAEVLKLRQRAGDSGGHPLSGLGRLGGKRRVFVFRRRWAC